MSGDFSETASQFRRQRVRLNELLWLHNRSFQRTFTRVHVELVAKRSKLLCWLTKFDLASLCASTWLIRKRTMHRYV